ncbi:MAG: TatD family hydrolase [Rickettsiales bacterium]|jgi:TatD DNase family protein|nr:TatD family hydrolase [Rickettsiales bacterium]
MEQNQGKIDFLVDSHCHLLHLASQGKNIDEAVERAKAGGVTLINNVCATMDEAPEIVRITNQYRNVFCSIGHHPDEVPNRKTTVDELMRYVGFERVVALGESGLDYHRNSENKADQIRNFEMHIEASRQSRLPLIIHSREADEDMAEMLRSESKNGQFTFVLHCFCSGRKLAETGLDLGGYISFSGIVTFKNAVEVRDIANFVPADRLIVETDSPYLAPVPHRGKVNEPLYVRHVAKFLSDLLAKNHSLLCEETTRNTLRLFSKITKIIQLEEKYGMDSETIVGLSRI